jgi:hypothetical protein
MLTHSRKSFFDSIKVLTFTANHSYSYSMVDGILVDSKDKTQDTCGDFINIEICKSPGTKRYK